MPQRILHFTSMACIVCTLAFVTSAAADNFYVDSAHGNDANLGTSVEQPWASLARANRQKMHPGDRLLLKAGQTYIGQLKPIGSGTESQPVVIESYGKGDKPLIQGQGALPAALWLHNLDHVIVSDVAITNHGQTPRPGRSGVLVELQNFGTADDITLRNLDVSCVNGSLSKWQGLNAGIAYYNRSGAKRSRFDGLTIEGCTVTSVDRDGIKGRSDYWKRTSWYPNLHVVIRNNRLKDIGGDGIVVYGCDGALVEHNLIDGARLRTSGYAAGIWPWSCDNTIIQYNEVTGVRGLKDGQAFDADYNCRHTLIQYNYSHDNDGGFVLICNSGLSLPENIGNVAPTIRYNVSYNDGSPKSQAGSGSIIMFSGASDNVRMYNNLIYLDRPGDRLMINVWSSPRVGAPDNVLFANNVFHVVTGTHARYDLQNMTHVMFTHNVFSGDHRGLPQTHDNVTSEDLPAVISANKAPDFEMLFHSRVNVPENWRAKGVAGLAQPAFDLSIPPPNVGPWP